MKHEGKKMVLTVLSKMAEKEAGMEEMKKSKACWGIFYQPKRPKKKM